MSDRLPDVRIILKLDPFDRGSIQTDCQVQQGTALEIGELVLHYLKGDLGQFIGQPNDSVKMQTWVDHRVEVILQSLVQSGQVHHWADPWKGVIRWEVKAPSQALITQGTIEQVKNLIDAGVVSEAEASKLLHGEFPDPSCPKASNAELFDPSKSTYATSMPESERDQTRRRGAFEKLRESIQKGFKWPSKLPPPKFPTIPNLPPPPQMPNSTYASALSATIAGAGVSAAEAAKELQALAGLAAGAAAAEMAATPPPEHFGCRSAIQETDDEDDEWELDDGAFDRVECETPVEDYEEDDEADLVEEEQTQWCECPDERVAVEQEYDSQLAAHRCYWCKGWVPDSRLYNIHPESGKHPPLKLKEIKLD